MQPQVCTISPDCANFGAKCALFSIQMRTVSPSLHWLLVKLLLLLLLLVAPHL